MEFLTSISTMKLSFYEWIHIVFVSCRLVTRFTVLSVVSHYSSHLQVAIMCQKKKCSNASAGEKEHYKLVNIDVNNAGFLLVYEKTQQGTFNINVWKLTSLCLKPKLHS